MAPHEGDGMGRNLRIAPGETEERQKPHTRKKE